MIRMCTVPGNASILRQVQHSYRGHLQVYKAQPRPQCLLHQKWQHSFLKSEVFRNKMKYFSILLSFSGLEHTWQQPVWSGTKNLAGQSVGIAGQTADSTIVDGLPLINLHSVILQPVSADFFSPGANSSPLSITHFITTHFPQHSVVDGWYSEP